jgi:hypothetical protein
MRRFKAYLDFPVKTSNGIWVFYLPIIDPKEIFHTAASTFEEACKMQEEYCEKYHLEIIRPKK